MAAYAELVSQSNFSFLEGASRPEDLVAEGCRQGLRALALTDRDGVHGVVRAHVEARRLGLHLLVGSLVTVSGAPPITLLAADRRGYAHLCRILSTGRRACEKGESRVELETVMERSEGLVALAPTGPASEPVLSRLREAFGDRLYLTVSRHLGGRDREIVEAAERQAHQRRLPLVATQRVLYHDRSQRELADVLTCIRHRTTLARAGRRLTANAERFIHGAEAMRRLFPDHPEWVERTVEVADRCTFTLDELRYRYPEEMLPPGRTPIGHLRELVAEAERERYGERTPERIAKLIAHELTIVDELDYAGYFLTLWDIVRFARSRGILCQGRGSAANSVICFMLGITSVDPSRIDLLFERFVSRERNEPPDIDVDFEHERREEVLQYVYRKYGRERAAMVAEVICYRGRSAVRDVGKALGLSVEQVDRLSRALGPEGVGALEGDHGPERLREAGVDPADRTVATLVRLARAITGFPRHLSIHVGGFLIAHERVDELVPIENAAMADRTVIQWDKNDIEALHMLKVDLLGLGMLSCIRRSFDLLRQHTDQDLTLATVPAEDPKVYEMICEADTVGVFQIESRAQMSMLPRLRPRCFYDLVVEVAIVRPGPIQGGMVHPYLRRRNGEEDIDYPHPALHDILGKTYGVPLFQEQVMRIASTVGGFTPGQADQLRRAMGAWRRRGGIGEIGERLMEGLRRNGLTERYALQIYRQLQGFGEYGFPESHAASFSLLVYVSAWLKHYHPAAFTCALLNSQPMGFYSPRTLIQDAQRHGVQVRPIDVVRSEYDSTLEPGPRGLELRLGLRLVRGMPEEEGRRLTELARQRPFTSVSDGVARTELSERVLSRLAAVGAFRELESDPRRAMWQVQAAVRQRGTLFAGRPDTDPQPTLPHLDPRARLIAEYDGQGLSVDLHPVGLLRERLRDSGVLNARELRRQSNGDRVTLGGLVIVRQRPGTAKGVMFLSLEDETGFSDIVVRTDVGERHRRDLLGEPMLWVRGRVQRDGEAVSVLAERLGSLARVATDLPRPEPRSFR